MKFSLTPADAALYIYEPISGVRLWPDESGKYSFSTGFTYRYSMTKYGYAGQSGAIQLTASSSGKMTLKFGRIEQTDSEETFVTETSYSVKSTAISLKLTAAKANPAIDPKIPAEWADFRGTAYDANGNMTGTANTNNGVTDAKIPFAAEEGTLYWASQIGKGYDEGAVGNPILVGGDDIGLPILGPQHQQQLFSLVAGGSHAEAQRQLGPLCGVIQRFLKFLLRRRGVGIALRFKHPAVQEAVWAARTGHRQKKTNFQKLAQGQIIHNTLVKLRRVFPQRRLIVLPRNGLPESVARTAAPGNDQRFVLRTAEPAQGPAARFLDRGLLEADQIITHDRQ